MKIFTPDQFKGTKYAETLIILKTSAIDKQWSSKEFWTYKLTICLLLSWLMQNKLHGGGLCHYDSALFLSLSEFILEVLGPVSPAIIIPYKTWNKCLLL
jgi:hypothetical protein